MRKQENMQKGKVWLAGAGPGAGDLLTVKTERLLHKVDCIVYDRLVGREVLSLLPLDKERIDVGKSVGHHGISQEEIIRILVEKAKQGKKVLRLKGGDPFLFGRGGEEAEALWQENIPFEVVPGISSFLAVPAYCGIPATHRDYASSVHVITGHAQEGREREIPYEALVKTKGTLVFLMGVKALESIMNGLLLAGMDSKTPAAILQQGTTAGQKKVVATVGTLAEKARENQVHAPSIILVGKVCLLEEKLKWYEDLPLFGEKILLTRPDGRGLALQERLKELGAEVLSVPTIQTVPIDRAEQVQKIQTVIGQLGQYQVLVFTSPYGVERFFALLLEAGKDIRAVAHMQFAVIGQGTADALLEKGIRADYMPEHYDGISLGQLLARQLKEGTRILFARSSIGSEDILREVEKNPSLFYTDLAIYATETKMENAKLLRSFMEEEKACYVVFASSSSVHGFCQMLENFPYKMVNAVCIGKKTQDAAKAAGMQTAVAKNATAEDLVECLLQSAAAKRI